MSKNIRKLIGPGVLLATVIACSGAPETTTEPEVESAAAQPQTPAGDQSQEPTAQPAVRPGPTHNRAVALPQITDPVFSVESAEPAVAEADLPPAFGSEAVKVTYIEEKGEYSQEHAMFLREQAALQTAPRVNAK